MTAAQEIELLRELAHAYNIDDHTLLSDGRKIGRASCRERV